jgi:HD superfamily phosphohydrolase
MPPPPHLDVVHGVVEIPEYAERVLRSPLMRRLGRVKQLGLLQGATHTRLEHSIGCMHLALVYCDVLHITDPSMVRSFALAALLHDVGHGPFSHTFENAISNVPSVWSVYGGHDVYRHKLIECDVALREALSADDIVFIGAIWRNDNTRISPLSPMRAATSFLHALLAGAAGVDRLDYVLRDLHYTSPQVKVNKMLIQLIMRETVVDDGAISYTAEGLKWIETFLQMRAHLYKHVYFNADSVSADTQLAKALSDPQESKFIAMYTLVPFFEQFDDSFLMARAFAPSAVAHIYKTIVRGTYPIYEVVASDDAEKDGVLYTTRACAGVDSTANIRGELASISVPNVYLRFALVQ